MKSRLLRLLASSSLLILFSLVSVQACAPGWTPDIFVRQYRPDIVKSFYAGKLGVLEQSYFRVNLIAAYRYLNGGMLAANEAVPQGQIQIGPYSEESREDQTGYRTAQQNTSEGPVRWFEARNAVVTDKLPDDQRYAIGTWRPLPGTQRDQYATFVDCPDAAFDTAADTLTARTKTWGAGSPALETWIKNQDAVFLNCDGRTGMHLPAPPAANAPLLLQQDTAYQTAAANFYGVQFDAARTGFRAVSQDQASPWHGIAAYLVVRTTVRQAMLVPPAAGSGAPSTFDRAGLLEARKELEALRSNASVPASAVQSMLQFVGATLDPLARLRDASAALAGPKPDANFTTDLTDLVYLLNRRLDQNVEYAAESANDRQPQTEATETPEQEENWKNTRDLREAGPLVDWLITFQVETDAARLHAVAQWKSTQSLPWLVAAIVKAQPGDADASALIDAAAKVPQTSPAWQTVTYHRARLLAGAHADQSRALLNTALPVVSAAGPVSAINAFSGLRMRASTSLDDFLKYAPRTDQSGDEGEYGAGVRDCKACDQDVAPLQFASDSAGFFNGQASLEAWLQAAQSAELPEQMRRALVLSGWTRAVVLNDDAHTKKFAALLPAALHAEAGDAPDFRAWLTVLRNGGLRFYLDAGVQRSQTYSRGADWWCGQWTQPYQAPVSTVPVTFLSSPESSAGKAEFARLKAVDSAPVWLGQRVIAYAKSHPEDKDAAEALHLTVRATRYGCRYGPDGAEAANSAVSAEAFHLLHRTYPASPWTQKTPYHF